MSAEAIARRARGGNVNDDVKKALEWLRGIVRTAKQEGDLFTHAEPLLAHIDAEPERLAAAVAREREEQREADARGCEDGAVCRCDSIDSDAQCGHCLGEAFAEIIRATPLTATPLADENKALRGDLASALAERDGFEAIATQCTRERDAALVRVKELEREVEEIEQDSHAWDKAMDEEEKAFAKGANEWMRHLLGPDWGRFWGPHLEAFGRGVDNMMVRVGKAEAERDDLKARLEELTGPVCTDAECPDHDGEHPYHFNAVALFWRRVEDTYENRNALCESAPVPPVQAWREERDALKARVAELEEGNVRRQVALEAERDELRQRILDSCPSPDEGGRIHAGGRIVCGQCHDSEVSHLRAQLAEAVEVLRGLMAALSADPQSELDAMTIHDFDSMADYTRAHNELTHEIAARAFLAKVKGFV